MSDQISASVSCLQEKAGAPTRLALLVFLIIGAWAANHAYMGITHDALLYAVQALARGPAPNLAQDLFLKYGSQDAYTLFTPLLGWFFEVAGVGPGARLFVFFSHGLWIFGAFLFIYRLTQSRTAALLVLLFVSAASPDYGVKALFSLGEGFATPRVLVEALTLIAFAMALKGHLLVVAGLMIVSVTLHPIMAVCGFGLILMRLCFDNWRWIGVMVVGAAGLALAAVLQIGPFAKLFMVMDETWLAIVADRNHYLFPGKWGAFDWFSLVADGFALLCAASVVGAAERKTYLSGFFGLCAGIAATVIGVEWMQSIFMIQAQPSRIFWITHFVALCGLGRLLLVAVSRSGGLGWGNRTLIFFAVAASILTKLNVLVEFGAGIALVLLLFGLAFRRQQTGRAGRLFGGLIALGCVAAAGYLGWIIIRLEIMRIPLRAAAASLVEVDPYWHVLIPALLLLIGLLSVFLDRFRLVTAAAGAALALVSIMDWDRRTDWTTFVEQGDWSGLRSVAAEEETVFWEGNAAPAWLGLRRQSYFTLTQGAGLAFVRETALEYERRRQVAGVVVPALSEDYHVDEPEAQVRIRTDKAALTAFCRSEGAPAVLFLMTQAADVAGEVWPIPAPFLIVHAAPGDASSPAGIALPVVERVDEFHIYRCADFTS